YAPRRASWPLLLLVRILCFAVSSRRLAHSPLPVTSNWRRVRPRGILPLWQWPGAARHSVGEREVLPQSGGLQGPVGGMRVAHQPQITAFSGSEFVGLEQRA